MTPQELRNSIFELAIEGKLVSQNVSDGTTDDLVEKIESVKKLRKDYKKIKSRDSLESGLYDDSIQIPSSWKWVFLTDVFYLLPTGVQPFDGNRIYYSTGSVNDGVFVGEGYYSFENRPSRANREHIVGDFLDAKMQGTIKAFIVDENNCNALFSTGFYGLRAYYGNTKYLKYLVQSPYFQNLKNKNCNGTTQKSLNDETLKMFVIPLPPIKEQERIVRRVDELLLLVDQYEKTWNRLKLLNDGFSSTIIKSILNYAMQGKLVNQIKDEGDGTQLYKQIQIKKNTLRKNEGIKFEKEIEVKIDDYENTFPKSWKLTTINNIAYVTKLAGFEYTKYMSGSISNTGDVPIVRAKNIKPNCFIDSRTEFISKELSYQLNRCALDKKCLLMTFIGAGIGETAIFDSPERHHLAPNVAKILPVLDMNKFMLYYLMSPIGQKEIFQFIKQTAQPCLSMETIRKVRIPLPPLKEQERIVAKIEELLPLCNLLK